MATWKVHNYRTTPPDPNQPFLEGITSVELAALRRHLGDRDPTPAEEISLKRITGCQTFGEFRRRVLSTHPLVDHATSLVLIEALDLRPPRALMTFVAYLRQNTPDEQQVGLGQLRRTLDFTQGVVLHHLLQLPERVQGQGLGTHLVQSHEEAWAAAGYRQIKLVAGLEDGRTYWGLQGYDFDPDYDDAQHFLGRMRSWLEHLRYTARTIDDLLFTAIDQRLTQPLPSWDIALLAEALGDPNAPWDRDWDGIKNLDDAYPGHDIARETRQKVFRKTPP